MCYEHLNLLEICDSFSQAVKIEVVPYVVLVYLYEELVSF